MPLITDYVTQGDPIDYALAELDDDGVRVEFPPGTYQLGRFRSSSDELELVAPDGDATLEIVGSGPTALHLSGNAWRVSGFEFDFRDRSPKQVRATGSGWAIRDCIWRGAIEWPSTRPSQAIAARVDYGNGEGQIRNCYFPDGSGGAEGYGSAIRVLPRSIGTLEVTHNWLEEFADPAIAAAQSRGPVHVAESYIHNTSLEFTGPAQVQVSIFVNDGPTPTSKASGRDAMRCAILGDRPTDGGEVYLEGCGFTWTEPTGGHPIDALAGVNQLTTYLCRFHNTTTQANVALGGGSADIHRSGVSGGAPNLRQTGGLIGTEEFTEIASPAASSTPPIPAPPPVGQTPDPILGSGEPGDGDEEPPLLDEDGNEETLPPSDPDDSIPEPAVGKPGGAWGRFFNAR